MRDRRVKTAVTQQMNKLLFEFVRLNALTDRMEFLAASEAWQEKYNAIKDKIPEEQSMELAKCEVRLDLKKRVIIKREMRNKMKVHSQEFKDKFDAYLSQVGKKGSDKNPLAPSLKDIKRDFKSFIRKEFYQDFKKQHPDLAEKFENWMNKRFQQERDLVLKREMKEHLSHFRDQMAYLHAPETAKAPVDVNSPKTLKNYEEQYDLFKQSEFYEEYKERFPVMAERIDELMAREIQQEKESLAEFRVQLHSKLDALNVDVATATVKSNLNPEALRKLDEFNQSINVHKDLEHLENRAIYQGYSNALDQLEADLEKPKRNIPTWVAHKTNPAEGKKENRHPMMGIKGTGAKGDPEKPKESEPADVKPSRRSSTRGSTS